MSESLPRTGIETKPSSATVNVSSCATGPSFAAVTVPETFAVAVVVPSVIV